MPPLREKTEAHRKATQTDLDSAGLELFRVEITERVKKYSDVISDILGNDRIPKTPNEKGHIKTESCHWVNIGPNEAAYVTLDIEVDENGVPKNFEVLASHQTSTRIYRDDLPGSSREVRTESDTPEALLRVDFIGGTMADSESGREINPLARDFKDAPDHEITRDLDSAINAVLNNRQTSNPYPAEY